ncbi:MAG: L,D-transpeptidase [Chloroflexi bacterium]|uniref:L,D-transpeptidase n=1 Tax=Candidatus Chlorohelix allophototropha TaxID=3003348 RepID=A0A8T7M5R4_9CHLR|nr:L,D-transpeptidase [Chloroflexota bacterium]WJW69288.1 L,D-transpeptidase [Chloroflexota bacterium L227-S17]
MTFLASKAPTKPTIFLTITLSLTVILNSLTSTPAMAANSTSQAINSFADPNFYNVWQHSDQAIVDNKASRSWYWGPKPLGDGFYEEYSDSTPYGSRLVQYFDKSRMEINDSSKPEAITNGLIVVEMITGALQKGDASFEARTPADISVAGDPGNAFPTYASLNKYYNISLGYQVGATVQTTLASTGIQPQYAFNDPQAKIATIQHNMGIPAAFWNFLNKTGPVYNNGQYTDALINNWLFSTGYPITEAYWTKVKVAGKEKDVLFQAFERRILTYTPSNPDGYKVEMGNVGQHYVKWRYQGKLPAYNSPILPIFAGTQPEWYEVTSDMLNVRTGPGTSFPNPTQTDVLPYLQQLYKGNHIQALKTVKGEKLDGANDNWLQFYENPDLFVYSGNVKKLTLPDMPTPPQTFSGPWVAVSLSKQMMAVYDGPKLLYKSLISSGVSRPGDPTRDFSTPTGSFKIEGSYRPKSQAMTGGASDKANPDYYRLEQVRNVSYFHEDYSIHGTYWHASFGIYPRSHGCVNATVYDAGLIYQLKAGTTVFIYM